MIFVAVCFTFVGIFAVELNVLAGKEIRKAMMIGAIRK